MKRYLSLLVALLLALSLAACGGSSGGKEPTAPSGVSVGDTDGKGGQEAAVSIGETVLVDEAGIKITAKSLSADSLFGAEVKLLIENDSGRDLTFQCRNESVNGYMIETMMSCDVASGKKANDSLTFLRSSLDACGIDTIADMEFSFHIFTTDDWEGFLDTPQLSLKTSAAASYAYTYDDSGETVYSEGGVRIVVRGLSEDDSIWGPGIVLYLENNSGRNITVQARDVSANGFMVDTAFSCDIADGKRAIDAITFFSSDLEENDIETIETVELSFHLFDSENWDTIADTDTVALSF